MKKKIFFIIVILCTFGITTSFAQKKSSTFKGIINLYEKQVERFFIDVFELKKTGPEMAIEAKKEMEEKLYRAFISDFMLWAKWVKKHQGEKSFVLKLKGTKKYETESGEYLNQFKLIQQNFVDERLIWNKEKLSKVLTQEKMQPYINPVVEKFRDRTNALFLKINK